MTTNNGTVNLPVGIYLNVRQEPNFYSNVLGSIAPKTEVSIIEQNGEWFKINYNSATGYVFSTAIKTTGNIATGGISLNLNIDSFDFGDVGNQPAFDWNARVTTRFIQILTETGEVKHGYGTSNGDHITIIKNDVSTGLTFIQYPDQGANMYQQGWVESSYISSSFLDFRFTDTWMNITDNQAIYTFNNSISSSKLVKNSTYTLLYTIENFNISYACITYTDLNNQLTIGFVPFSSGKLNMIVTDYPYNILNGESTQSGNPTVPVNATVGSSKINVVDVNGITVDGETITANSNIAIVEIFLESQTMLVEYYNAGSNKYLKGYIHVSTLYNKSISVNKNTVTWNNPNGTYSLMNLSDSKTVYKLPASQTIQYLYTAGDFACILFNNNNASGYPLQTAYVPLTNAIFRDQYTVKSMFTAHPMLLDYGTTDNLYNGEVANKVNTELTSIGILPYIQANILPTKQDQNNFLLGNIIIKDSNGDSILKIVNSGTEWSSSQVAQSSNPNANLTNKMLNTLNVNETYSLNVAISFYGILVELPLKYLPNTSNLPYGDFFKFSLSPESNILFKLLPRYFFIAQLEGTSYSKDSVSLDVNIATVNIDNDFIFNKTLDKSLVIKDLSGNTITSIVGTQNLGTFSSNITTAEANNTTNFLGLSLTLPLKTLASLTDNIEYKLFIGFNFKDGYIELPLMFNDSTPISTNFCYIYASDSKAAITQPNTLGTSIEVFNKEFAANLQYANVNSADSNLYLVGNIIGNALFTKTTQKNLILKNASTHEIVSTLPTTPTNWFSSSSDNYSAFKLMIGTAILNKLNPADSYNVFISFMFNKKLYEVPVCNNLNIANNQDYSNFMFYFNPTTNQLGINTFCNIPITSIPVSTAPTVQNPWTGIIPGSADPIWVPIDRNAPSIGGGAFVKITSAGDGAYGVIVGKNTFYYPESSIIIVQK